MRFPFYVLAVVAGIAGGHVYLWVRVLRGVLPSPRARRVGKALLALLALICLLAVLRPPFLGEAVKKALCAVGFPWVGVALLVVCALLVTELVRVGVWAFRRARGHEGPIDPARRRTLEQVLGGAAVAAGGATALAGAAEALHLVVERIRVPLARLPQAMSGTRIVQISDVHLGLAVGPEYWARVLAEVNALAPDLVAITGDLVDASVAALGPQVALLRGLVARHGVFFVTGNHEYYVGASAWAEELTRLGVRVLRNERVSIGEGEDSFDLAGVEDWGSTHRTRKPGDTLGHDLPAALAGRDDRRELILLAHQPTSLYQAVGHGVGLQLSGHTHGGQIYPLRLLIYFDQPFIDGLHRLRDTWIYVSRGTGYWGPPMRVGSRPEITEITIVRA
jgi:predicted MPP superfamily phosphohydrolase